MIDVTWTPDFVENCAYYSHDLNECVFECTHLLDAVSSWCDNVSNETIDTILDDNRTITIYGFDQSKWRIVRILVPFRAWFESLDDEDQRQVRG
jgi:hypothetical protein